MKAKHGDESRVITVGVEANDAGQAVAYHFREAGCTNEETASSEQGAAHLLKDILLRPSMDWPPPPPVIEPQPEAVEQAAAQAASEPPEPPANERPHPHARRHAR